MRLVVDIKQAAQALWFGVFPPICLLCGLRGQSSLDVCTGCYADLTTMQNACSRCAEPLAISQNLCGRCNFRLPVFDKVHAPYLYTPPLTQLITHFKYQRQMSAGHALGQLLAESVEQAITAGALTMPDCLVPVPLHPWRQVRRGFNQSALLAGDICRYLQAHEYACDVNYGLLQRIQTTRPQSGLNLAERRRNLRGVFKLNHSPPKHIALIDDVLTSGSTANECARVLKAQGCETVQVWVVARAERPK